MTTTRGPRERRFRDYLERLAHALGHEDRREPLRAYLTGLCLGGDRKSIVEQGLTVREDANDIVIGYDGEPDTLKAYPKSQYGVLMMRLGQSFFDWRGAVTYSVERETSYSQLSRERA